ncbi:MAG: siroheme synthase [Desulfuromonas sp.]|nr:MAG: siroheme synthase [Desulfuromonas sp.]
MPESPPSFPLFLDLRDRLCVVVGGGAVGLRKIAALHRSGAMVRLIAPAVAGEIPEGVEWICRPYRSGDSSGACLVFAASSDRAVNAAVAAEAKKAGIFVNVADAPQEGDMTLPAVLNRGQLTLAVGTQGASPALASCLRDRLAEAWTQEWATVVELAAALRRKRLTVQNCGEYNQQVLRRLLAAGLHEKVAAGDQRGVEALLAAHLGGGWTLAELGVELPKGMP